MRLIALLAVLCFTAVSARSPGFVHAEAKAPNRPLPLKITSRKTKAKFVFKQDPPADPPAGDTPAPDPAADAIAAATPVVAHTDLPTGPNGEPLEVGVTAIVKSIFFLAEDAEQIGVELILRLTWHDDRFEGPVLGKQIPMEDVFNPNIQFLNAVHSEDRMDKVMIYPQGKVIKVKRMFLTLRQKMNYKWFPFDDHVWFIQFNSFTYNDKRLVLKAETALEPPGLVDSVFEFKENSTGIYEARTNPPEFPGQTYSTITVLVAAHRNTRYFLSTSVVPNVCLIIIISLTFWMGGGNGRIGLGALLSMGSLLAKHKVDALIPEVGYSTWLGVLCQLTFVFAVANLGLYLVLYYRIENELEKDPDNSKIDWWLRRVYFATYISLVFIMLIIGAVTPHSGNHQLAEQMKGAPVGGFLVGARGLSR